MRPLLDESVRELWLSEARLGRPPPPKLVAELEWDLVIDWWQNEAFIPLCGAIDPNSFKKTLRAIEASRGAGKSQMASFLKLYLAEWVLPFLNRRGLDLRQENKALVCFGRDEQHLRNDIIGPMAKMILTRAPWLRTGDWKNILEDPDDPAPDALRQLSEMKSKGLQRWDTLRLDLSNGITIRSRTLRQSVRGLHVLYCDIDDPLEEKNAHESAAILDLIQSAVLPAIEPGGLLLLLGTPQQPGDLFDLVKDNPDWIYSQYPAYDADGSLAYAAKNAAHYGALMESWPPQDRYCLWPLRLPYAALEQARGTTRESNLKFEREYLLRRVSDETALVHYDHIVAARDPNLSYHHSAQPGHHYKGGVDPSKLKKDEAGFCVGYATPDGTMIPAAFASLQVNPRLALGVPEMRVVEELNSLSKQFNCYNWKVESNGFQSAIAPLTHSINASIRFTDFHLGSNKHTENGWAGMRTTFRSRKVRLPYQTPEDRSITDRFIYQLRGLQYVNGEVIEDPKRHNDLVSAFFLWLKNMEEAPPQYSITALGSQSAAANGKAPDAVHLPGQIFLNPTATEPRGELRRRDNARIHQAPTLPSILAKINRWTRRP